MYWRVVFDYGNHREYLPVHSSEFAATLIAKNKKALAAHLGDRITISVEKVRIINNVIITISTTYI